MNEINHFLDLKTKVGHVKDMIDQLNKEYKIDNKKVALAKMKVDEAVNLISLLPDNRNRLSDEQTTRILNMVYDLGRGKREVFILMRMSDGTGIYDPLTGKTFKYE
jgi:transcription termination factor Rho